MKIRVVLVDDNKEWIVSMTKYLNQQEKLVVVGTASNKQDALMIIKNTKPEVVLLDINLTDNFCDGIPMTNEILAIHQCKIIMLSVFQSSELKKDAIITGASNYISKYDFQTLPMVIEYEIIRSREKEELLSDYRRLYKLTSKEELLRTLTAAEKELIEQLEEDEPIARIAGKIYKSEKTLRNQLTEIFRKLKVKNRVQLVEKLQCHPKMKRTEEITSN